MAVDLVAFLDSREQLLVIVDLQIGMDPALHKNASTAQRQRFFDFLVDDVIRQDVGLVVALHAVERAEGAEFLADVGVIDIPIDDVADDVLGMPAQPDAIRRFCQVQKIRLLEKKDRVVRRDA